MFFDDVRVPVENLVGEENKGWDYAKFLLANERIGIARVGVSKARLAAHQAARRDRASMATAPLIEDPLFREKLAEVEVELKALEMTQMRVVAAESRRDARQARSRLLGAQDQGLGDPAGDDRAADGGRRPLRAALSTRARSEGCNEPPVGPDWARPLAPIYFNTRKVSIYGGSNEIQRNIIAKADTGALSDMDFDLSRRAAAAERQRRAADRRPLRLRAPQDLSCAAEPGWSRAVWAQLRRAGPARRALRRGGRRLRRRRRSRP